MPRASTGAQGNNEEAGGTGISSDDGTDAGIFRLDLSDATPLTKPIDLGFNADGTRRIVMAHAQGKRVLRSVESDFYAAWKIGHRVEPMIDEAGNPVLDEKGIQRTRIVETAEYQEAITRMILAVIPSITYDEADAINMVEARALMRHLGWFVESGKG